MDILFKKPPDMRYVDLMIWIDNNAYKEDCDNNKLYEYLYILISKMSSKQKLMNTWADYMDFYMWAASRVYMRLKSPKQYILDEDGNPKLQKIRSISNFLNSKIRGLAIDFVRERKAKKRMPQSIETEPGYTLGDVIDDNVSGLKIADFNSYMHSIPDTIHRYLSKIPYASDHQMFTNICTSCLLSFLSSITLTKKQEKRLNAIHCRADRHQEAVNRAYDEERSDCVILYHLDDSMHDYILLLTRCLSRVIMNDLSQLANENMVTSGNLKTLMLTAVDNRNNEGDN